MKIVELDGKPFIRVGARTLSPIDASSHFAGLVKEAQEHLSQTARERMQAKQSYRRALETGEPFDRTELAAADRRFHEANGLLDAAKNELEACRTLLVEHLGRRKAAESQARINEILFRFPEELA